MAALKSGLLYNVIDLLLLQPGRPGIPLDDERRLPPPFRGAGSRLPRGDQEGGDARPRRTARRSPRASIYNALPVEDVRHWQT